MTSRGFLSLSVLLAVAFSAACGTDTTEFEEPPTTGLVISDAGQPVVVVQGQSVSGTLEVLPESQSPLLQVVFMDAGGFTISTQGRYMDVSVTDESIATVNQTSGGAFSFRMSGVTGGVTAVRFSLVEGEMGSGTTLYTSVPITIDVVGIS
jgi:hypothetical protein